MVALAPAVRSLCAGIALLCAAFPTALAETRIEGVQGQQYFSFEYREATDFSGLTWAGGNDFYTVSDKARAVFSMKISVEPLGGRILSASVGAAIPIQTKLADFEGIAFVPDARRIYVSAETGNGILGFDLRKRSTFPVSVPRIFSTARNNKSLESLTYWSDGGIGYEGKESHRRRRTAQQCSSSNGVLSNAGWNDVFRGRARSIWCFN